MRTLKVAHLLVSHQILQTHSFLAMASHDQEIVAEARQNSRGPRCHQCKKHAGLPLVLLRQDGRLTLPEWEYIQLNHRNFRLLCYDCLQELLATRHGRWWKQVFHGPFILDNLVFQSRISQYLWRSICFYKGRICRCGRCEQAWLDRGWTCWG